MARQTSVDLLNAGNNAIEVSRKNRQKSTVYKLYYEKFKDIVKRFKGVLKEINRYEENWLKQSVENRKRKNSAEKIYKKYIGLLKGDFSCPSLVGWQNLKVPADELVTELEDIADILEACPDLMYSEDGRLEVIKALMELDSEVKDTSDAHDLWRIKVVEKNKIQDELCHAFKRFRQYARKDMGYESEDYQKLSFKGIRKSIKGTKNEGRETTASLGRRTIKNKSV